MAHVRADDDEIGEVDEDVFEQLRVLHARTNARAGDAGRFDLKYGTQAQSSDRGICLSALGHVRLVAAGGTC